MTRDLHCSWLFVSGQNFMCSRNVKSWRSEIVCILCNRQVYSLLFLGFPRNHFFHFVPNPWFFLPLFSQEQWLSISYEKKKSKHIFYQLNLVWQGSIAECLFFAFKRTFSEFTLIVDSLGIYPTKFYICDFMLMPAVLRHWRMFHTCIESLNSIFPAKKYSTHIQQYLLACVHRGNS